MRATLGSVLGGVVGFLLGQFALEAVMPWIERAGQAQTFADINAMFWKYDFWIVVIAGFTPIPYEIIGWVVGLGRIVCLPLAAVQVSTGSPAPHAPRRRH